MEVVPRERQLSDANIVLIDATRVQNAEELGAVISASINTFPGKDPLKAKLVVHSYPLCKMHTSRIDMVG